MDKDTKIELLKIVGMIIILISLIWGIVWLNKNDGTNNNKISTSENSSNEDEIEDNETSNSTEKE